jgi:integrase/recombinase XerD
MSYSYKVVVDKRYNKGNNTHPLKLRIYEGSKYKEKSLGIFIAENDWDDINQVVLPSANGHEGHNARIQSRKAKVQKLILLAELNEDNQVSLDDIIAGLSSEPVKTKTPVATVSLIRYGEGIAKALSDSGKVGNAYVYNTAINKLKVFVKSDHFPFESLTYKKLNEFQDSLLADGIKVNSISVYMRTIRAIYNRAIKEGIVSAAAYPFSAYRVKNEKTVNRTLSLKEMQSIANVKLEPDTPIWHWRNFFLLSFCLIGINFADLLTLSGKNIVDGRIVFRRKKTGKIYTIKLHDKALDLLGYYADINQVEKEQLLLPVLKQTKDLLRLKKDTWQAIKTCNEYLVRIAKMKGVEIKKDLSTYYGRYSWANIARSLGYSKDIIGQALGHSYGSAVTSIYLDDYDNKIIDDANRKVISIVFNSQAKRRSTGKKKG